MNVLRIFKQGCISRARCKCHQKVNHIQYISNVYVSRKSFSLLYMFSKETISSFINKTLGNERGARLFSILSTRKFSIEYEILPLYSSTEENIVFISQIVKFTLALFFLGLFEILKKIFLSLNFSADLSKRTPL